jgi:ABC-type lipoprotein export system ATPase subunit
VTRSYSVSEQHVRALNGIDLVIPAGTFVVLMGRSGSGKTTLLNMIGGLDKPTTGEVYINGRPLSNLSDRELTELRRKEFGFVFQSFALLPILSAAENVELPLRISGGLSARERYEMSGGQQQRVAIARALVSRPRVIIGDEPTGDLDSKTTETILRLLRSIVDASGVTLVMSTHDPSAEEFADAVYHLQDGQIVDQSIKAQVEA